MDEDKLFANISDSLKVSLDLIDNLHLIKDVRLKTKALLQIQDILNNIDVLIQTSVHIYKICGNLDTETKYVPNSISDSDLIQNNNFSFNYS